MVYTKTTIKKERNTPSPHLQSLFPTEQMHGEITDFGSASLPNGQTENV